MVKTVSSVISSRWYIAIHWYSFATANDCFQSTLTLLLLVDLQVTPLFCLVTAVQGAHRRVHEELEASIPAVKILQNVFGEWTKATETKDEARTTEEIESE